MKKYLKNIHIAGVILVIVTIAMMIGHIAAVFVANSKVYTVQGKDESSAVYMDVDFRGAATSSWLKRDVTIDGKTLDLTGATIDENLYNNSDYPLKSWTLQINIQGDCFINQAWNGEMEIHQYVGTKNEKVQQLNLQDYDLSSLELDYYYDGDLLIPLQEGDYVIYHPSDVYKENTIQGGDKITMGVIFYYADDIDLSDYQLVFSYQRSFSQGTGYIIFLVLVAALFTSVVATFGFVYAYRTTEREAELQKTAVSCMSDIYQIIYIIIPSTDVLIPVCADENSEKMRPRTKGAREQLKGLFVWDADELYQDVMQEFADLNTIGERLTSKNSVAAEYISKHYGWCRIRIFAMNPVAGKAPEKILFTIQNINDEKMELENVRHKVTEAESENRSHSAFLSKMSSDIRTPLCRLLGYNDKILSESSEQPILGYSEKIKVSGDLLLTMVDGLFDYSKLQAGLLKIDSKTYSLRSLVSETLGISEDFASSKSITLSSDISPLLPDSYLGDSVRLKQVLANLIQICADNASSGEIKLSIFGKANADKVHLLFSVKTEGTLSNSIKNISTDDASSMDYSLITGTLKQMGSELKIVPGDDTLCEFYFEIEQSPAEDPA